jgi:hypothetical protein
MSLFPSSHLYTRLKVTIPAVLPWSQGSSSTKGDPRKSVKWIDVRFQTLSPAVISPTHIIKHIGPSRNRFFPSGVDAPRPRLGL